MGRDKRAHKKSGLRAGVLGLDMPEPMTAWCA